jgi:hypothetical protein
VERLTILADGRNGKKMAQTARRLRLQSGKMRLTTLLPMLGLIAGITWIVATKY